MCLFTVPSETPDNPIQIAKTDIHVFKLLIKMGGEWCSPYYRDTRWRIGERKLSPLIGFVRDYPRIDGDTQYRWEFDKGIHGFLATHALEAVNRALFIEAEPPDADRWKFAGCVAGLDSMFSRAFHAIIPKGSKYVEGMSEDFASDSLILGQRAIFR